MPIDFSRLLPLGWSNFFSTQIPLEVLDRVRPARVARAERDRYGVDAGAGEFFATLAGRYRHEHEGEALPTVGDWALLATDDPVIVQCLERRTLIARRAKTGLALDQLGECRLALVAAVPAAMWRNVDRY